VEEEWLELVLEDVRTFLQGTLLASAPVLPVSAVNRHGFPELLAALDGLLDQARPREDLGRPRLPIDRVFTVAGFGTVVTGTLVGGSLKVGQEVEVQPQGLKARIRGLQTHQHSVAVAQPGSRVAVNLTSVAVEDLQRGDVITIPGWLRPTTLVDVRLQALASAPHPLEHSSTLNLHVGSAERTVKLSLLQGNELQPGETSWAQLKLTEPVAVAKGDFFVLRSPNTTVGGGEIVDAHPRRHRRTQPGLVNRLEVMAHGEPDEIVLEALGAGRPADLAALTQKTGLPLAQVRATLQELEGRELIVRLSDHSASARGWQALGQEVRDLLAGYHRQQPLRAGMPREELKSRLGLNPKLFAEVVGRLQSEDKLAGDEASLRLPEHKVELSREQEEKARRLLDELGRVPYAPPSLTDLQRDLGLSAEVINVLVSQGRIQRVSDGVAFTAAAYNEMLERIKEHLRARGSITVAEVRDMFGASRKYALALLEHLDEQRITRRVGDERVLR
jgi:selenocysteine-specific elongation factor